MSDSDNDIISKRKIAKAKQVLYEINHHLQFGYFHTAINRIYYASFYAAQALLAKIDAYPKSHKGVLNKIALLYVQEGKFPPELARFLPRIFNERQLADYADIEDYDKETVEELFATASAFVKHIETLLKEK